MIPNLNRVHEAGHSNNIPGIHVIDYYFEISFFLSTISEWSKLDWKIRDSGSLSIFKKNLIFIIHTKANSYRDHKFRHYSQDIENPFCDFGNVIEAITHFFLHFPSFHFLRKSLLNNIRNINEQILSRDEDMIIETFLYGNPNCNLTMNRLILNATAKYQISTERFKCPILK